MFQLFAVSAVVMGLFFFVDEAQALARRRKDVAHKVGQKMEAELDEQNHGRDSVPPRPPELHDPH